MENQHRKISGYRELSQAEIDLMNEIKAKGEELGALCVKISKHVDDQYRNANNLDGESHEAEYGRLSTANPCGWLNSGEDDLKIGIMKLVRAVAQPTTF